MTKPRSFLVDFALWILGGAVGWMTPIVGMATMQNAPIANYWFCVVLPVGFVLPPLVIGIFQMLALRLYLVQPRRWVFAVWLSYLSIGIALLGQLMALVINAYGESSRLPFLVSPYWLLAVGASVGAFAGFIQWLFLEVSVTRNWSALWILAHAGIGAVVLSVAGSPFHGPLFDGFASWLAGTSGWYMALALLAGVGGALTSAVTGALILPVMHRRQFEPIRSDGARTGS